MYKFLNKLTYNFTIKKLIYFGLFLMFLSISSISIILFYTTNTLNSSQIILKQIFDIEKETRKALSSIQILEQNRVNILIATTQRDFDVVEEKLINAKTTLYKVVFKKLKKYEAQYNSLLMEIQGDLNSQMELQNEFFHKKRIEFIYKREINSYLKTIDEETNKILKVTDILANSIILQVEKDNKQLYNNLAVLDRKNLKLEIKKALIGENNIKKNNIIFFKNSVLKLTSEIRSLILSENSSEIETIKNKKLNKIHNDLSSSLNKISIKKLSSLTIGLNNNFLKINELETAIIGVKQQIFRQQNDIKKSVIYQTKLLRHILNNIGYIQSLEENINNDILEETQNKNFYITLTTIVIGIFSTLFLVMFSFLLVSRVHKPLTSIIEVMSEIVRGEKKLAENITVEYNDEYKLLSNAFNKMTSQLSKNIRKLRIRDEEISILNNDLQILVDKKTAQLSIKTQKVSDLLNNAAQGFLSFSKDLLVDEEYSTECEKFLQENLVDQNIVELLFLKDDKKEFYKKTLCDALEAEDNILANSFIGLLPNEVILNKRALKLEYKILNDNQMMLIMTNISSNKKLEKSVKEEQNILKMIVTIVSNVTQFFEIKNDFESFVKDTNNINLEEAKEIEIMNEFYRNIHTFKGLFSQVYMSESVLNLHKIEDNISKLIKDNDFETFKKEIPKIDLSTCIEEDIAAISKILGTKFFNNSKLFKVKEENIINLENIIKEQKLKDKTKIDFYDQILVLIKKFRIKSLDKQLFKYDELCKRLAKSLDKNIKPLEVSSNKDIYLPKEYKSFISSLVHLFRNCIDHGIEPSYLREELGKDLEALIKIDIEEKNNILTISISDDGAGIDIDKLKEKALTLNLYTKDELINTSDDEILSLIFKDSFSTKDEVTFLSGRGVGMSAVKEEVDKLDAKIKIETKKDIGTKFIFTLPIKEF